MDMLWTTDCELMTCQHMTFNITSTDTVEWGTIYSMWELSTTVGIVLLAMFVLGEGPLTEVSPFFRKDSREHVHYLHIH